MSERILTVDILPFVMGSQGTLPDGRRWKVGLASRPDLRAIGAAQEEAERGGYYGFVVKDGDQVLHIERLRGGKR